MTSAASSGVMGLPAGRRTRTISGIPASSCGVTELVSRSAPKSGLLGLWRRRSVSRSLRRLRRCTKRSAAASRARSTVSPSPAARTSWRAEARGDLGPETLAPLRRIDLDQAYVHVAQPVEEASRAVDFPHGVGPDAFVDLDTASAYPNLHTATLMISGR